MKLITKLFIPVAILRILDSMVSTPLDLLFVPYTYEANACAVQGYSFFGISYFFLAGFIELALTYLMLVGYEEKLLSKTSNPKYRKSWKIALIVGIVFYLIINVYIVFNNFSFFFNYIRNR